MELKKNKKNKSFFVASMKLCLVLWYGPLFFLYKFFWGTISYLQRVQLEGGGVEAGESGWHGVKILDWLDFNFISATQKGGGGGMMISLGKQYWLYCQINWI